MTSPDTGVAIIGEKATGAAASMVAASATARERIELFFMVQSPFGRGGSGKSG